MKTSRILLILALVIVVPSGVRALSTNEEFFQFGIGYGKIEGPSRSENMTMYSILLNHRWIEGGLIGLDVRGSYTYGDVNGSNSGSMQDSDVNLILSFPKIPIVKPYAIAGVSYDKFSVRKNFGPRYNWDFNYNIGAGAEFYVLPMLPINANITYTNGDAQRVTYLVDGTFWFTKIGVGANFSYQDGHSDFGIDVKQANIYVAVRF